MVCLRQILQLPVTCNSKSLSWYFAHNFRFHNNARQAKWHRSKNNIVVLKRYLRKPQDGRLNFPNLHDMGTKCMGLPIRYVTSVYIEYGWRPKMADLISLPPPRHEDQMKMVDKWWINVFKCLPVIGIKWKDLTIRVHYGGLLCSEDIETCVSKVCN